MKALTIKQPYAHEIVFGDKRVENRSWDPPQELIGSYIAIHAGMSFVLDDRSRFSKQDVNFGAILGVARIERVVASYRSRWFAGPRGWVLRDVRPLARPIPARGALRLWTVSARHEARIRREYPDVLGK